MQDKSVKDLMFAQKDWGKLKLFFRLYPQAKKSSLPLFLGCLTSLRIVNFLIPFLACVSFRLDGGSFFAFFCLMYIYTTFGVATPRCLFYIKTRYGKRAFKLLGWNTPQVSAWLLLRGAGLAVIAKTGKTAYDMHSTSMDGIAEMHRAKVCGAVEKTKNQVNADVASHKAALDAKAAKKKIELLLCITSLHLAMLPCRGNLDFKIQHRLLYRELFTYITT
jgi:hypothetical protein